MGGDTLEESAGEGRLLSEHEFCRLLAVELLDKAWDIEAGAEGMSDADQWLARRRGFFFVRAAAFAVQVSRPTLQMRADGYYASYGPLAFLLRDLRDKAWDPVRRFIRAFAKRERLRPMEIAASMGRRAPGSAYSRQ